MAHRIGLFSDGLWEETGEIRKPIEGESWINSFGAVYTGIPGHGVGLRSIVRKKVQDPVPIPYPSITRVVQRDGYTYEI